jgi:hypothetical protein
MERIGVGQARGQGRPGDVRGQGGQSAGECIGGKVVPVEVGVEGRLRPRRPRAREQAVAGTHDLGEQVLLGREMGIEGATGQAGCQHDVVDVGAAIAAQPEQPGGVLQTFGPDAGRMGG